MGLSGHVDDADGFRFNEGSMDVVGASRIIDAEGNFNWPSLRSRCCAPSLRGRMRGSNRISSARHRNLKSEQSSTSFHTATVHNSAFQTPQLQIPDESKRSIMDGKVLVETESWLWRRFRSQELSERSLCWRAISRKSNMTSKAIDRANSHYLTRSVQDLLSLKGRVTVITGGARGIGLSFAVACAEAGSDVAVLDRLGTPHEHFTKLENDYGVRVKLYQ